MGDETIENIRVLLRVRPEEAAEDVEVVHANEDSNSCVVAETTALALSQSTSGAKARSKKGKSKSKSFAFDRVFGPARTQADVYAAVDPLVESAVNGYNATVFAYGSTGSGKTYTISGSKTGETKGIIPRAVGRVFELAKQLTQDQSESLVLIHMAYVELYNNQVSCCRMYSAMNHVLQDLVYSKCLKLCNVDVNICFCLADRFSISLKTSLPHRMILHGSTCT